MVIRGEREKRRATSKSEEKAGDIIWVRLPSTHIMVIRGERERRGEQRAKVRSKLVILYGLDYRQPI